MSMLTGLPHVGPSSLFACQHHQLISRSQMSRRRIAGNDKTVQCGKKNGSAKHKRPKEQDSEAPLPAPQPLRVTNHSLLSVRQQQRLARAKQEAVQGKGAAPIHTTRFRKRAPTPEERAVAKSEQLANEERARRRKGSTATLMAAYDTKDEPDAPVLLVDGYNLLFHWRLLTGNQAPGARQLARGDMEGWREEVAAMLRGYSACRGIRLVLAWDAMGRQRAQGQRAANVRVPPIDAGGMEEVFCGQEEADSFIVSEARALREQGQARDVLVSTSDQGLSMLLEGRAIVLSNDNLLYEIKQVLKEWEAQQQRSLERSRRGPSSFASLSDMRNEMVFKGKQGATRGQAPEGDEGATWAQRLGKLRAKQHTRTSVDFY